MFSTLSDIFLEWLFPNGVQHTGVLWGFVKTIDNLAMNMFLIYYITTLDIFIS